jgi:hypothetical protein
MAALLEQVLGMRFLEIARADFWGGNVRGDSEHRHARAVAVEPAVNKMQVAWAAASGAHGKGICQARFGTCRKCGNLFMADMQPLDLFLLANSVGQAVQAIPDDAVDPLDASRGEEEQNLFVLPQSHCAAVFVDTA